MGNNKLINFFKDNFTFFGITVETSNDYVKLYKEARERFKSQLSLYDEEVKRFADMLRYSDDNGQTLKEIDCLVGNINYVELNKIFSSSDLGLTFTKNDDTTKYYIEKINDALKERADFISKNTTSQSPYFISYDTNEKNRLYSDKTFPFIDTWSKDNIEQIKRNARNKRFRAIRDLVIIICGILGSFASLLSIFLYFYDKQH